MLMKTEETKNRRQHVVFFVYAHILFIVYFSNKLLLTSPKNIIYEHINKKKHIER